MPAPEVTPTATTPYAMATDEVSDAPYGAENLLDPQPTDLLNSAKSEGEYRRAVLDRLDRIIELLSTAGD